MAIGGAALETEFIFYKSYAAKLLVSTYLPNQTKPLQPQGLFISSITPRPLRTSSNTWHHKRRKILNGFHPADAPHRTQPVMRAVQLAWQLGVQ